MREFASRKEKEDYFRNLTGDERYDALNDIIASCRHIVFFGGAGVSTESGIPDFRSKDGLYNNRDVQFEKYSPEYLLSHSCLYYEPKVFFEFYRQKLDTSAVQPNRAHKKLAEMEAAGKLDGIITQNIDGLHQRAGSKNVQEIHGTTYRNYCTKCRRELPADFIFNSEGEIPLCPHCGGMVRPDVTLYEEGLPEDAWNNAMDLIRNADCLIIGGTSLAVSPASYLVYEFRGDYLIIMNRDSTPQDRSADLIFHESIGDVFSRVIL